MKTSIQKIYSRLGWLILFAVVAWSCENENSNPLSPAQKLAQAELAAKDNSQIVAATQDIMDVTAGALAGQGVTDGESSSYGRVESSEWECAPSVSGSFAIDRSHADSVVYTGTLTIDYGAGTACKDSTDVRKGKIMDSFVFVRLFKDTISFRLTETVTFQGFQKDSVQVDGTFTSKSSSAAVSTLDIKNAKLTYSDGTSTTWSGLLTTTLHRKTTEWKKFGGSVSKEVTGSINGTSRSSATFSANITKPILFSYSCFRSIPVSGTIDVTVGAITSIVDYGTGSCDKVYTITTNGDTKEYSFKNHHHM